MSMMTINDSLRLNKFDGSNKLDFTQFKEKLPGIGKLKDGFNEALETNLPIVDAAGDLILDNIMKQDVAWSSLILLLEGLPLILIHQIVSKDPFLAWNRSLNVTNLLTWMHIPV